MDYTLTCTSPNNLLSLAMLCVFVAAAQADFPQVSKLPSQPGLPDPLVMFDGEPGRPKPVADKEQWIGKRRPELKALFQHYMYGYTPAAPARVTPTIEREDSRFFGGKAT